MLEFNVKTIKVLLLLAAHASPILFTYINFTSIYEIVVCSTQNEEKYVSFSRKEGTKAERDVGCFTWLAVETIKYF